MLELGHEPKPAGFQNSQIMGLCVVLGDEYNRDPTPTEIAVQLESRHSNLGKTMIQMGERAKCGYGGCQEMGHLTWVLKDE